MSPLALSNAHPWDLTPDEAVRLQKLLRARVLVQALELERVQYVGGVDVGFRDEKARAAVVVLNFPALQVVEQAIAEIPVPFPYIPGLLSFRETPAILAALEQLKALPDVLICDGQGLAHPRRFGIACHLGVLLDRPTLGCAKSILVGRHGALSDAPGSTTELVVGEEVIGIVVRTRKDVKPVYISIGHRIDLPSAVNLVLACTRGYRLPEPTRLADRLASRKGTIPGSVGPLI
jgi:deoxyribonuclease V